MAERGGNYEHNREIPEDAFRMQSFSTKSSSTSLHQHRLVLLRCLFFLINQNKLSNSNAKY